MAVANLQDHELLLEYGVDTIAEVLVEGLSRVKKCNNEGRALMSLDLQVSLMCSRVSSVLLCTADANDIYKLEPRPGPYQWIAALGST